MNETVFSALLRVVATLVVGVALGSVLGSAVAGLIVALFIVVGFNLFNVLRLERELRLRKPVTVPAGTGVWAQVLAQISYLGTRISRHKSRYRALLREIRNSANALPDGVVSLNTENEMLRYNGAARKLIGLRKRRDRGQRIDNLIRHPDFIEYLQRGKFKSGITIPSPLTDGDWLWCIVVPYGPTMRLLLLRDVTEQTRLVRMRRDFVANASHELRSPLTVISGYLDSLSDDPDAPEVWRRPIAEMRQQSQRMGTIINDLLELSRLESNAPAGKDRSVDVAALLAVTAEDHRGRASVPELIIDVDTDGEVLGNSAALQSIVSNLLENAIRHTPADGTITLRWSSRMNGGADLVVEDTGEGIAEDDIPRLTERFFRVNRGRSRDNGGTGLGLAIVKHALARHEAELIVNSTLGAGSRFICRFPASRIVAPRDTKAIKDTNL